MGLPLNRAEVSVPQSSINRSGLTVGSQDPVAVCAQVVARSQSADDVVNAVLRAVVPSLCDWCIFFACGPRPGSARVFKTHPIRRHFLEGLGSLDSAAMQSRLGVIGAALSRLPLRTRDSVFGRQSLAEQVDLGHIELIMPSEVLSVPVMRGQSVFGVLTLARSEERPPFEDAECELAEKVCAVSALWFATTRRDLLPAEFQ